MFVLDVRLRFGAYDAGAARVPGAPEWPPEPSRVFCALVAGGPDEDEWQALKWLEQQGPPEVRCSVSHGSTAPAIFVITNETVASSPLRPGRKADKRTKPSSYPALDRFAIVWPDASADAQALASLQRLARRVPYVGRSSAQATVEARTELDDAEEQWRVYVPVDIGVGSVDLGVPYPGYCDELEDAYQHGRRAWEVRRSVEYGERPAEASAEPANETFGPLSKLLILEGDVSAWSISQTGSVTAALRSAVMSRVPDPLPPALDGHTPGIGHVGFLALANVGSPAALDAAPLGLHVYSRNRNADGRLMALALSIPSDMASSDVLAVVHAVSDPWELKLPPGHGGERSVMLQRQIGAPQRWATSAERWIKPSRVWATATPVVFDQFSAGRSEEMMVARALVAAGYPAPCRVVTQRAPILPGAASHTVSSVMRRAGQPTKPFTHAWVEFDVDVIGPVMAGSMRYRGLGLFVPLDATIADDPLAGTTVHVEEVDDAAEL